MKLCKTEIGTNEKIDQVMRDVATLMDWANADAEHAMEKDAHQCAKEDRARAAKLLRIMHLLNQCRR
jgi:hypothetical protein